MSVFVDTGVLFAAAARRDARHQRAAKLLTSLVGEPTFTTDHVLVETWSLAASRAGWEAAMALWDGIASTPLLVECVAPVDLERAHSIARRWADLELDIVDCTSFAVMERLGCERAATFDRDFAVYRYGPRRRKAFEILM